MAIRKTGRKRLWKKLGLLCGSTAAALLVAELALRLPHWYYYWTVIRPALNEGEELSIVAADNPELVYTLRPNVDGANSQGYLDDEYSVKKGKGLFRIVVIGDSIAAGQGVPRPQSFTKLLQRKLNESSAGLKFEVIALARSGYSTSQELVLLRTEAFQYDPDLILWSYCLNDPAHPLFHDASGDLTEVYRPKIYLLHLAAEAWFRLKERIKSRGSPKEFHKRLHYIYWDQVVESFHTIGRLCAEHGVPAVLLIHPVLELNNRFGAYSFITLHQKLQGVAAESGLLPLDLLDAYGEYRPAELRFPEDQWHPNVKGHQAAAEFLYRRLIETARVPAPARREGVPRRLR